jgi:hypothetical protein
MTYKEMHDHVHSLILALDIKDPEWDLDKAIEITRSYESDFVRGIVALEMLEGLVDYVGYGKMSDEVDEDKMRDAIHEYVDNQCTVYNSDIMDWVRDNYNAVDQAHDEGFIGEWPGIVRAGMIAWCFVHATALSNALEVFLRDNS